MSKFTPISVHDLGDYLREQRHSAHLSLRQLSEMAGVSNPYLSQIERGLKKPSAEILQGLAKGLRISAESLYVRAGILEERTDLGAAAVDVPAAILADRRLSDRQRGVLLDVYESFVGEPKHSGVLGALKAEKAQKAQRPTKAPTASKPTKTRPSPSPARTNPTQQLPTKQSPTKEKQS